MGRPFIMYLDNVSGVRHAVDVSGYIRDYATSIWYRHVRTEGCGDRFRDIYDLDIYIEYDKSGTWEYVPAQVYVELHVMYCSKERRDVEEVIRAFAEMHGKKMEWYDHGLDWITSVINHTP